MGDCPPRKLSTSGVGGPRPNEILRTYSDGDSESDDDDDDNDGGDNDCDDDDYGDDDDNNNDG